MNLVKKIILDHYDTHFKATIRDTFIDVRKIEIVPKSHVIFNGCENIFIPFVRSAKM